MKGYFGLGQLSATDKQDILDQHKSLYNGYRTMQPQVSNTQPLYTHDFAGDKDGMVVNNKGEVKKYTNMGINEQVEEKEMCEQCGDQMIEGVCEQCSEGEMGEGRGKSGYMYDVMDLGDNDFDYVEGGGNDYGTFEKMHHMKKIKSEGEYEDPDNEDDGFEDLQVGDEIDEDDTDDKPYEKGKRGMKASRARASFAPTPQENEILNNLFGQYGEDIPPIVIRYLRKLPRKTLLNRLVKVGLIDKDLLQGKETMDEQGGNAPDMDVSDMNSAYDFVSDGPMAGGDVYETEEEMREYEDMESAFEDELDEVDVSGSQGIYGDMDPAYDFDSEGPGKAGPYQTSSYNEDEMEDEDEEEFDIDEDLQESFHNQKNKINEMMSRMKRFK